MIYTAYKKDIGARESQQDSVEIVKNSKNILIALGDGMGGHTGGERASQILVTISKKAFVGNNYDNPEDFFNSVIATAHKEINLFSKQSGEDPNTTVAFALIKDDILHYGNIGDSRVYIFNKDGFITRTRDHSVPEMLFQMGEISEEEMATHPDQNKLTKSLGPNKLTKITYKKLPLNQNKDYLVLVCSDGFWEYISQKRMYNLLNLANSNIDKELDSLITLAKQNGGANTDNISVAIIKIKSSQTSNLFKSILKFIDDFFTRIKG